MWLWRNFLYAAELALEGMVHLGMHGTCNSARTTVLLPVSIGWCSDGPHIWLLGLWFIGDAYIRNRALRARAGCNWNGYME